MTTEKPSSKTICIRDERVKGVVEALFGGVERKRAMSVSVPMPASDDQPRASTVKPTARSTPAQLARDEADDQPGVCRVRRWIVRKFGGVTSGGSERGCATVESARVRRAGTQCRALVWAWMLHSSVSLTMVRCTGRYAAFHPPVNSGRVGRALHG